MRTREVDRKLLCLESYLEETNAPADVRDAFSNLTQQMSSVKQENVALAYSNVKAVDEVQKLEEKSKELSEAQKSKDRFIECISHEIRTPLHYIINFADLGKFKTNKEEHPEYSEYFDSIIKSGYKLLDLIENLINLSDMASGDYKIYPHLDDIRSLIKQSVFKYNNDFLKKEVELKLTIPEQALFIKMDAQKITKAICILIENALKFSHQDDTISISLQENDHDLEIFISDTGPGIPEEELQQIFESFTQSTRTMTRNGGSGLGLALCQQIIKAHGGHCQATNNDEKGCTFSIKLKKDMQDSVNEQR